MQPEEKHSKLKLAYHFLAGGTYIEPRKCVRFKPVQLVACTLATKSNTILTVRPRVVPFPFPQATSGVFFAILAVNCNLLKFVRNNVAISPSSWLLCHTHVDCPPAKRHPNMEANDVRTNITKPMVRQWEAEGKKKAITRQSDSGITEKPQARDRYD